MTRALDVMGRAPGTVGDVIGRSPGSSRHHNPPATVVARVESDVPTIREAVESRGRRMLRKSHPSERFQGRFLLREDFEERFGFLGLVELEDVQQLGMDAAELQLSLDRGD